MSNFEAVTYRAVWERAQSIAMCQVALVNVALGPDEFVGFCAGYVGEGRFVYEPYHVIFKKDAAVHLVIGDRSVLTSKEALFENWPKEARLATVIARNRLKGIVRSNEEGFYVATATESARIRWDEVQVDEGTSAVGTVDKRVWLRIPAQLGLTASGGPV